MANGQLDLDAYLHQQAERWRQVREKIEAVQRIVAATGDKRAVKEMKILLHDVDRYAADAREEYEAF